MLEKKVAVSFKENSSVTPLFSGGGMSYLNFDTEVLVDPGRGRQVDGGFVQILADGLLPGGVVGVGGRTGQQL